MTLKRKRTMKRKQTMKRERYVTQEYNRNDYVMHFDPKHRFAPFCGQIGSRHTTHLLEEVTYRK